VKRILPLRRFWYVTGPLALSLGLIGCGPKEPGEGTGTAEPSSPMTAGRPAAPTTGRVPYPGDEAGARALLAEFVKPGADHAALTKGLRPTKADLEAIFTTDLAAKLDTTYGPAWESGQLVVAPKEGQTQVQVFSAASEEIKSGAGGAADFPGGWKQVADKLKPGIHIYRFKFVEPGKDSGMAFDGLVHVNGNWRIVPKPWRGLE
jgi:hypothetical protein